MAIKIIKTKQKLKFSSKIWCKICQIQSSSLHTVMDAEMSAYGLKNSLKHTKTMTNTDDDFILQLFLQHKDFTKHNYLSVVLFLVSFICLLVKPPNNLQFLNLWYYGCIIRTNFFDNWNCIIRCWQITQGQATFSNSDITLKQTYAQKYKKYQYCSYN